MTFGREATPIIIDDVLHPDFVSGTGAGRILGYARQTIHNKVSDGTLKLEPFGRVMGAPHVYRRTAVVDLGKQLGRPPVAEPEDALTLLDEFDRYNAFETTYVNSPFYQRVQRALGRQS